MYKIDKTSNRIQPLQKETFSHLGFSERDHLQEWIANEPEILGEELLIIQKEFSEFDRTRERPDLIALDKEGALVIIENKLDSAEADTTWQALKYASYFSTASKEKIAGIYQKYLNDLDLKSNAEEEISTFMGVEKFSEVILNTDIPQRIILVAREFRPEVTSTVLWLLMNFNVPLQCFRATPFSMGEDLFLTIEQIIPIKDAEDYMVGITERRMQDNIKRQEETSALGRLRKEFWFELIKAMQEKSQLFANISPGIYSYISAGSGVRGVGFVFSATQRNVRVELYIDRGEELENQLIFEELEKEKEQIEKDFEDKLVWQALAERRACRIKTEIDAIISDKDKWNEIIPSLTDTMCRFEKAIKSPLMEIRRQLRND